MKNKSETRSNILLLLAVFITIVLAGCIVEMIIPRCKEKELLELKKEVLKLEIEKLKHENN